MRKDLTTQDVLWNQGYSVSDGYLFDVLKVLSDNVTIKGASTVKDNVFNIFNLNEIVDMSFSYDKLIISNYNYMSGAIVGKMFGWTIGLLSGLHWKSFTVESLSFYITLKRGSREYYLTENPNEDIVALSLRKKQKYKELKEFITGLGVMI